MRYQVVLPGPRLLLQAVDAAVQPYYFARHNPHEATAKNNPLRDSIERTLARHRNGTNPNPTRKQCHPANENKTRRHRNKSFKEINTVLRCLKSFNRQPRFRLPGMHRLHQNRVQAAWLISPRTSLRPPVRGLICPLPVSKCPSTRRHTLRRTSSASNAGLPGAWAGGVLARWSFVIKYCMPCRAAVNYSSTCSMPPWWRSLSSLVRLTCTLSFSGPGM